MAWGRLSLSISQPPNAYTIAGNHKLVMAYSMFNISQTDIYLDFLCLSRHLDDLH